MSRKLKAPRSWGGARVGAGRYRQRIALDTHTARLLALLKKSYQRITPDITEEQILATLITQAWHTVEQAK